MAEENQLQSPVLRFKASKLRRELELFLASEAGQAMLLCLPYFRPAMNVPVNAAIHGAQTTLQEIRADSCAQNIGFQRCFEAILELSRIPPEPRGKMQEPDYKHTGFPEIGKKERENQNA